QFAAFLNAVTSDQDENGQPFYSTPEASRSGMVPLNIVKKDDQWSAREGMESHPVVYVTWFGASAYARWAGGTLPSEAQWEVATNPRGMKPFFWGEPLNEVYVWYLGNSGGALKPVGTRQANFLGLFDTLGNVWEWCLDAFDTEFPKTALAKENDPVNLAPTPLKSLRGGAWNSPAAQLHVAFRTGVNPFQASGNIGFRVLIPERP
ncbi:MAG: formylglycine-generating enzyme family protein, partial [Planctomycetota bacterium]